MEPVARDDSARWNARYGTDYVPSFEPHPVALSALALAPPPGPVLDLACGPSGSALAAAEAGRHVTAVDISDVALGLLEAEAARRGLAGLIALVRADLNVWRPGPASFAVVLCTGYWDRELFAAAAGAPYPGGLLGWQALTEAARADRPQLPAQWCLRPGEPASLLAAEYDILINEPTSQERGRMRRLLARRGAAESTSQGPCRAGPRSP
jgi:SAM-dependent methyltransferase